jgi:GH25 family lysozyme M1 (1,4-beta-N-acetylmuramidase)
MKRFLVLILICSSLGLYIGQTAIADSPSTITTSGPGGRIFGLDISRYQHTKGQPVDFAKMYAAGVRFLWINGGNTLATPDLIAATYYFLDRAGAQEEGIYTGLYYYAHLPNTTVKATIIANANNQANKIVKRLQEHDGLNALDMPVALDLETNCVSVTTSGICRRSMGKSNVTLWAKTWMARVATATARVPLFYSYIGFINAHIAIDPILATYPLWISTARIDPAISTNRPTLKSGRCPSSPWIDSKCNVNWQFWQYTGVGAGARYGLQSGPADLDIFFGSSAQFLSVIGVPSQSTFPTSPPASDTSTVTSTLDLAQKRT